MHSPWQPFLKLNLRLHPTEARSTLRKNIELQPSPKIILVKRKELNTLPSIARGAPLDMGAFV